MFNIGIVGYGNFGSFLFNIFSKLTDLNVKTYSPSKTPDSKKFFTLINLFKQSDLIILAVSINRFASLIYELTNLDYINKKIVIMDVASVKEYTTNLMTANLSNKFSLVASHPMFGHNTFLKKGSLNRLNMMIHNINTDINQFQKIKILLTQKLGLNLIEMSPVEHDKLAARSQFFAQTVKLIQDQLDYNPTPIDTASCRDLFEALSMIGSSKELYLDMLKYNKYAQLELEKITKILSDINYAD